MTYVRLKHALSAAVLAAVDDPDQVPTVEALAACAAAGGGPVSAADLSRAAGVPVDEILRRLLATGLCLDHDGGRLVGLDARFRPHAAYAGRQTARAVDAVRVLRGPAPSALSPVLWRAVVLFNAGLFFECHEYLERPWRAAGRAARAFYHGLIQAAAGCYHCEKRERPRHDRPARQSDRQLSAVRAVGARARCRGPARGAHGRADGRAG